jgi:hypothetical protein
MRASDFARLKRNMMDSISRMTDSVNWNGLCDVYASSYPIEIYIYCKS